MSAAPATRPNDYQAIRIGSLTNDYPTSFDTYIKVGSRFVLYCRNGDVFDADRLFRLKQKNIEELYILKTDIPSYELYLDRNVDLAYHAPPGTSVEERANKIVVYNTDLIERFIVGFNDIDVYLEMKSSSRRFVDFLVSEPASLQAILNVPNTELKISAHGVRVAAIATALAQHKNMVDKNRPTHLMVAGAFLHDLAFADSGFDYRRPLAALSKDEVKEYRKHSFDGAQKLQTVGHMDILVKQIILQHEEHADGTGFPKGLKEDDMDPSVLLVGASNAYDRLVSFEGQAPKDALKALLIDKMGAYQLSLLQQLQAMLKSRSIVS